MTGGAGFIGSALIRYLITQTPHEVVNVDKLTYAGSLDSLSSVSDDPRYRFEQADIGNAKAIAEIFLRHQPDLVMHLAAETHVDRSISGPVAFVQTNVLGTCVLLEETRAYWGGLCRERQDRFRFHHVSTDEVFGDLGDSDEFFREDTPYAPSSPYSASKAGSDHLVRAWGRTFGLPLVITNCSNNYGPYHHPEKLIPLTIIHALEGKQIPVYGRGDQIRDWLFVEDHVRALVAAATKGRLSETYNIGGRNEKRNIDVVRAICDVLDDLVPMNEGKRQSYRDLIKFVDDRPGHDVRYAIDASKIEKDLGWVPEETFESGLRKTVEWYISNRGWWQDKVARSAKSMANHE